MIPLHLVDDTVPFSNLCCALCLLKFIIASTNMGILEAKINPCFRPVLVGLLVLCLTLQQTESSATGWNYVAGNEGAPGNWSQTYPHCGGVMQSPINIVTKNALYDIHLQRFDTSDYSITDGVNMTLENVGGHTAELVLSGRSLYLKKGSLPDKYKLIQVHFHWGSNSTQGSEHSIDGVFFPMEVHFVHKQRRYASVDEASPSPFGLAVLAFLFQIGDSNPFLEKLVSYFDQIPNPNDEVEIPTLKLSDMIPPRFDFFRYSGSLTTPPCYESVIWSIATEPITISEQQLEKFRALYNEAYDPLVNDFRPIQPLNQRAVLTTKKPSDE